MATLADIRNGEVCSHNWTVVDRGEDGQDEPVTRCGDCDAVVWGD